MSPLKVFLHLFNLGHSQLYIPFPSCASRGFSMVRSWNPFAVVGLCSFDFLIDASPCAAPRVPEKWIGMVGQGWTGLLFPYFANFYRVITSEPKDQSVLRRARSAVLLPKQWMPQGGVLHKNVQKGPQIFRGTGTRPPGRKAARPQGRKAARLSCFGPQHFGCKRQDRPASR